MIIVPAWVLAAAVVLSGCATCAWCVLQETENKQTTPGDNWFDEWTSALGMIVIAAGLWLLWIGRNPEPLSAWIAIAGSTPTSAWIAIRGSRQQTHVYATAISVTGVLMAATFIVRASLPGFE